MVGLKTDTTFHVHSFDSAISPLGIYLKAVIVDGKKLETFVMSTIGDWLNKLWGFLHMGLQN